MAYHGRIPTEVREQVVNRIQNEGVAVATVSAEHGISTKTIYGWLSKKAATGPNILQMNKLKRENDDLKRLLAEAVLMNERSKKNQSRYEV